MYNSIVAKTEFNWVKIRTIIMGLHWYSHIAYFGTHWFSEWEFYFKVFKRDLVEKSLQ